MDYQEYQRECERIRAENTRLLAEFEEWLFGQGIRSKNVRQHVSDVEFYIDEFLLYDDSVEARYGASRVGMFLGYWYINKNPWASKAGIADHAASLTRFYEFMCQQGQISEASLSDLRELVRERMATWLAAMDAHNESEADELDDLWASAK